MQNIISKKLPLISLIMVFIISLSSCTIEKRIYRKGFHVSFNHIKHKQFQPITKNITKQVEPLSFRQQQIDIPEPNASIKQQVFEPVASINNELILEPEKNYQLGKIEKGKLPMPKIQNINYDLNSIFHHNTDLKNFRFKRIIPNSYIIKEFLKSEKQRLIYNNYVPLNTVKLIVGSAAIILSAISGFAFIFSSIYGGWAFLLFLIGLILGIIGAIYCTKAWESFDKVKNKREFIIAGIMTALGFFLLAAYVGIIMYQISSISVYSAF